ncbi:MAG TPA: helix-turn-helix domain-containing protein [Candidatus Sulfotelmatobacter sp.]|nr:helix-turn-helix domain-containing protein [Candidatus Sulfotelmatobacter sp.]
MSEKEQHLRQVEKVAASSVLHGSEALCKLLRYLAHHAIEHPGTPVKEYQIATEEFGRPPDFDPAVDSMVRVQAGRLRTKLSEYYAGEGSGDPVRIELPKGTYTLAFQKRDSVPKSDRAPQASAEHSHLPGSEQIPRAWLLSVVVLSLLLVGSLLALYLTRKPTPPTFAGEVKPGPAAFQTFWKPFLTGTEEPWVVFSNAAFVGRPETGMRYYNSARDPKNVIWDHYTGVGEVIAVHNLDQVFSQLHRNLRVKRGSLFSLDDAQNNDLIFVGSPSENLNLLEIPGTREFVFQRVTEGPRKGDLAVFNVHPQPGEQKFYLASPSDSPLIEDYALLAFIPGLNPSRSVMIVAGTTTFGTQGAVEYACREKSVEELLLRLSVSDSGELKPFEALLHVKIAKGVPVETNLVSLRKVTAQ